MDVTTLVMLFFTPGVIPTMGPTVIEQLLPAGIVTPDQPIEVEPQAAVIEPPEQPMLPVKPQGVPMTRPAGRLSLKPTPVSAPALFGLASVNFKPVDPFSGIDDASNFLVTVGGIGATVRVAEAVPPVPPSLDVTALVVLFFTPAVMPTMGPMFIEQLLPAGIVTPDQSIEVEPQAAVIEPPEQPILPLKPQGVPMTRPAGSVSLKPTPVSATALFGLASVNDKPVDPFRGIDDASNFLVTVGGNAVCASSRNGQLRPPRARTISRAMERRREFCQ